MALSLNQMEEAIAAHAAFERKKDWDGTLTTMVAEPHYDYYPYRLRVSGGDAIKVMWIRTLTLDCLNYDTGRTVVGKECYSGDDSVAHVIHNTFPGKNGELIKSSFVAIFHFDDEKIISETIYFDENMTRYFDEVFADPDFLSLPGVENF